MSEYLTALKTTTRFKSRNEEAILNAIKERAKGYDDCYGWKKGVLAANKLQDIADMWNIELYYTDYPAGSCIPILRSSYGSTFLTDIAIAAAPYMVNGYIEGLDDYGRFKVKFKNGVVAFEYKNLFTPISYDDMGVPFA